MVKINSRVYVPRERQFGTVSGSVIYGFGILTGYRVSLDDGRVVMLQPDALVAPNNIVVLGAPFRALIRASQVPDGAA